ncbi:Hypothetical predicted protein [Olea europaea subsp. europaea]|uniref:Uncharacterized protein n=1 Tax=Olea europaea subsp. europaea TaxID=158383 RepID=A0A8S0SZY4_OLEEU|nr:Hypothetical predicted protein [Olea europaea subsp. europaea]
MSNFGLSSDNRNNLSSRIRSVPEFKPRKVSAVRAFPPGCGLNAKPVDLNPNAPQPTQEEQQMINRGKGFVDDSTKIEVETDAIQTLRKNLERGALMDTQIISQTESVDGVEKVEVRTEAVERLETIRGTIGEDVMKLPLSW